VDATTSLLFMAVLLVLSGFFSGSETALFALTKLQRRRLEREHHGQARLVTAMLAAPKRLLITILIGNMTVNTLSSATATALCLALFADAGLGVAVPAMTILLLIFGELTPKVFAVRNSEAFSLRVVRPLSWFGRLVSVPVAVVEPLTDAVIEFLAPVKQKTEPAVTRRELEVLVKMGEEAGEVRSREKELVDYIFEFQETVVREVMTPRVEIDGIKRTWSPDKVRRAIRESRSARMPVYNKDLDDIDGILTTKRYLLSGQDDIAPFVEKPYFIPASKRIQSLLQDFRSRGLTIAIVLDEYGGVVGLVTLEDLLEELFGEVYDEDEQDEEEIRAVDDGSFRLRGSVDLDDVAEALGTSLCTDEDEYDTIAGFCLAHLGRLAGRGDEFRSHGWIFRVTKTFKRRIVELTARPEPPASDGDAGGDGEESGDD